MVRQTVGYHRYSGDLQVDVLNGIYALLRDQINFFTPQQKQVSKTRIGAKVIKKHDTARTPFQRLCADGQADLAGLAVLREYYARLNPAAIRREIVALSDALAREVTCHDLPVRPYEGLRDAGISGEATTGPTRAS